ncbi:M16 family metallopeptidase [Flavisolibacter ginsenosidimutans]|uniref:Insulinase family protein n=1 Tax=Flavisolibacter ginsenosidimutans TaxID=661481 RepID=A0A5B8UM41_9BACT|nr:pitrilysin family protein [Flavisolibacter ginsenosidimutans]QEC57724.1 insulinase family protein [Flavisolibacter ginsenosidimutans]
MRKKLTGALCLLFLVVAAFSQAKLVEKVTRKGNELVIPYEKYVLPNGLTLIVHEDHSDPVVHVDVTYHVGSAREEIGKSGFAHFFEHMMFQGSDHVADEQHFKIVTEAGGTLNGSTNRDRTNYYETIPSNQLEKALWLESDRMGFLLDAVTQKKFEVQRATVKNERGQNYDNRPYGLQSEYVSKALYPYGHPYSWLTIGYIEDLNRSNANDLKNFFLRWYGPNNATLTIGGDVNTANVVKLVEKYFGTIPSGPKVTPVKLDPVVLDKTRYTSYVDNYARASQLRLVYPTVPEYHPDGPALSLLAQVLGGGGGFGGGGGRGGRGGGGGGGNRASVFYQTLIKTQKALQASAFNQSSELAGEFSIGITPYPESSLSDMESLVNDAFAAFEKRGVTDDDVEKFKTQFEARTINGLQSVSGKVSTLAAFQTFAGNPNLLATLLDQYKKLTKEDVMRVYNQYIKGKNHVVLSTLTKGQEATAAASADNYTIDKSNYKAPDYGYAGLKYVKAKDNFDRKKIPGNGPNPVVKVPQYWRKDLPSGVKMIGTQNTEIPTVTLSISIPGGHLLEAADVSKAGVASFFARMMNEDTKNFTAEQFGEELQKLGSSISVSSGTNDVTFNVQSLKKNLDKTLALLQERMFNPKFSEETFKRIQRQSLEGFKQMKSQPAAVASAVFAKLNYGSNHILAIPEEGTEKTVPNIKLEDVQNYYNNNMTSLGTKVVIVGDVTEAEILPKLSFLDKLPKKKVTLPKIDPTPSVDKTKVYLVDVPKAAQSEFRVGYATGLKYDATGDYYRAYLMNFPLGGAFNSRVNLNLREDKGWTYGARSGFTGDEYSGDFSFSSGIKADATDSALVEVMKELKTYSANGPTDEEISFMKSAVGQRDALAYETGMQKAAFIGRILDYNLPPDFVEQQNKILKNMTSAQMKAAAQKYLHPEKMNILLVGDKKKILDGVKKLGYDIVELDADGNLAAKQAF